MNASPADIKSLELLSTRNELDILDFFVSSSDMWLQALPSSVGEMAQAKNSRGRHLEVQKKVWILRQRGPMQALCDCHCMRAARISCLVVKRSRAQE